MELRQFKFYAIVADSMSAESLAECARNAEEIGFDALVVSDHTSSLPAPLPTLAGIASATTNLRIGSFVLNNDFRHPAILAQESRHTRRSE